MTGPNGTISPATGRLVFLTVCIGVFMSTMDSSMVNVALPELMRTFACSLALVEWVVLSYLLTVTMFLVFWGRLCNRWGCGNVYLRGMLLFSLGSLLCGFSYSIWMLILFRFVQALGASMMMAAGPVLVKEIFPAERLGRGLGLVGVATSLGLMAGPLVSGLILRWLHWRAIFWVTAPVGLVLYLAGRRTLPDCCSWRSGLLSGGERGGRFDLAGALSWFALTSLTLLAATHAASFYPGPGIILSALFGSGVLAILAGWVLFIRYEMNNPAPFLPVRLFRKRFFAMAIASSALSFAVLFFALILMPFYLDHVLGLAPDRIGFLMMALPCSVFIVSPLAGGLYDRFGARQVATGGLLCCLTALILLTGLTAESRLLSIAGRLALLGFGQAMFLSPNSASALAGVSGRQAGTTASLLATARNFGMMFGTALAGLSFSLLFSHAPGTDVPAFLFALSGSFRFAAALALCAVVASWFRGRRAEEG